MGTAMRTTFLSTQNLQRGRERLRLWIGGVLGGREATEEPCSKALQTPKQESSSSTEEEGEHVEDLAVDREVVEGSGDEPLGDHVGGRACRQVPGDQLHCLRSAVGGGEEEPCDELREALSGDALLLPQQGDRDGEGGAADLQVRSQHEGLSRQGQKRPELPAESLNKSYILLFKIHSVPRRETIFVNKTFSHFSIYSEE